MSAGLLHSENYSSRPAWIGLDVGGTKIQAAAVDEAGALLGQAHSPTGATSGQRSVESIIAAIRQVMQAAQVSETDLAGIGIGIPGKTQNGIVSLAVHLKLSSYPLAQTLSDIFHAPVFLENDVRTAALGVYRWVSEQRPVRNLVYLSTGTGISAGVILGGRLFRGSNGMAGEVGHIIVEPGGKRCQCGSTGCLETIASGHAIAELAAQQAAQAARDGNKTLLNTLGPISAEKVFHASRQSDPTARAIVDRAGAYLGRAIYSLLMTYDPDLIVLGGGVSHAGEAFMDPIRREISDLCQQSPLVREMLCSENILLLPQEYNPGVWGALALAKQTN